MAHLFVSYRHETVDFAYLLASRLEELGFTVVINPDPRAGEGWSPWIDRVIGEAFAVIALVTPESGASPFIAYEWSYALGAGIDVIPLLLSETDMHPRLNALQPLFFIDPLTRPWQALFDRLWALGEKASPIEVPENAPGAVSGAVAMLGARQAEVRSAGVEILAAIDHPAARSALVSAAQHPIYRAVRLAAVSKLAQVSGQEALTGLLAAVRDPDTDVSRAAAQAISTLGDAAVPGLLEIERGPYPVGPRAAVWALSLIGTPATVPGLIEALRMEGWFAPRTAAVTLGKIGDAQAVPELIGALQSEDEALVELVLKALRQIGTPEALEAVEKYEAERSGASW